MEQLNSSTLLIGTTFFPYGMLHLQPSPNGRRSFSSLFISHVQRVREELLLLTLIISKELLPPFLLTSLGKVMSEVPRVLIERKRKGSHHQALFKGTF